MRSRLVTISNISPSLINNNSLMTSSVIGRWPTSEYPLTGKFWDCTTTKCNKIFYFFLLGFEREEHIFYKLRNFNDKDRNMKFSKKQSAKDWKYNFFFKKK